MSGDGSPPLHARRLSRLQLNVADRSCPGPPGRWRPGEWIAAPGRYLREKLDAGARCRVEWWPHDPDPEGAAGPDAGPNGRIPPRDPGARDRVRPTGRR